MNYVLLTISIISCLVATLMKNSYGKNVAKNDADVHLCNIFTSLICFVLFLAISIITAAPLSWPTVGLGVVFGIFTAFSSIFGINAYKYGPASYTTFITTASMIIPALSGAVFFNETVGLIKIVGIVLMLVCIFLSVYKSGDGDNKKAAFRWLVYCLLAAVSIGLIGITQKVHQTYFSDGLLWFLTIAFAVSTLYSTVVLFIGKNKTPCTVKPNKKVTAIFVFMGLGIMLNNILNLYLSGVMDSMIFFPVVNGSGLLLMLIASTVFLKEKLTPTQWIGIAVGAVSIALLCVG